MSWWQHYIRWRQKSGSMDRSAKIKKRLSMAYLFCAWNAFAILVYYMTKEKHPKTLEDEHRPSKYYARVLRTPDAKVLRFEGFKMIEEYEVKGMERSHPFKLSKKPERQEKDKEELEEIEEREELEETVDRWEQEEEEREDLNLLVEEAYTL